MLRMHFYCCLCLCSFRGKAVSDEWVSEQSTRNSRPQASLPRARERSIVGPCCPPYSPRPLASRPASIQTTEASTPLTADACFRFCRSFELPATYPPTGTLLCTVPPHCATRDPEYLHHLAASLASTTTPPPPSSSPPPQCATHRRCFLPCRRSLLPRSRFLCWRRSRAFSTKPRLPYPRLFLPRHQLPSSRRRPRL